MLAEDLLWLELFDGLSFFLAMPALFDDLALFAVVLFDGLFEARLGEFDGDLETTAGYFFAEDTPDLFKSLLLFDFSSFTDPLF